MTHAPSPVAVGLELLIAIALLVALAVLGAHLEYRRRWPRPRGRELDAIGRDRGLERMPRESDRRYLERIRSHIATPRRQR